MLFIIIYVGLHHSSSNSATNLFYYHSLKTFFKIWFYSQYLGNDLEDIRGRTVYEDGAEVMLPLLPLPGMPVPGQVIPLHLFQQHLVAALRSIADSDKTFGIVTYR